MFSSGFWGWVQKMSSFWSTCMKFIMDAFRENLSRAVGTRGSGGWSPSPLHSVWEFSQPYSSQGWADYVYHITACPPSPPLPIWKPYYSSASPKKTWITTWILRLFRSEAVRSNQNQNWLIRHKFPVLRILKIIGFLLECHLSNHDNLKWLSLKPMTMYVFNQGISQGKIKVNWLLYLKILNILGIHGSFFAWYLT